jgi:hypothetical protein
MKRHEDRKAGYVIGAVMNGLMIYVFHNLLAWGFPFITPQFAGVLWAFDLSLGAAVIANLLFLLYDPGWFRHFLKMALAAVGFNAVYVLYTVFPFRFDYPIFETAMRIALILALVGTGIGFIAEFIKLISSKDCRK